MTTLNTLVTSKETSQKLYELGVRYESAQFWWISTDEESFVEYKFPVMEDKTIINVIPALLAGEISAMLYYQKMEMLEQRIFRTVTGGYGFDIDPEDEAVAFADNEAEIRGIGLCWLIENGMVDITSLITK